LEGDDDRQAAKHIVQGAQKSIQEFISIYNKILQKFEMDIPLLSIESLRSGFLEPLVFSDNPDKRSLASTFITFFLEFKYRDFQLSLRPGSGTNEPFFIHLFKGCLLFESLLKNNPTKEVGTQTLYLVLRELSDELGLPNNFSIGKAHLSKVLEEIVTADDQLANSIILTGRLRNTLGHDLGWPSLLLGTHYRHGFLHIGISCLHSISVLYCSK
jgi:hypothetical protein